MAEDQAVIDFRGSMNITQQANFSAVVGVVSGSATLNFAGTATVNEEGNGSIKGFRVFENGQLNMSGTVNLYETGIDDSTPFTATDNALINYSGNMHVELGSNAAGAIILDEQAKVRFSGGSLTMLTSGAAGNPPKFFSINEDAAVQISGGSLQMIQNGVSRTPYFWMTAQGRLTIVGHHFNFPLGEVFPRSGIVSGVLMDGTPFSYQFSREEKALLILVPEPSAFRILVVGLLCGVPTGRRRHVCFLRGELGVRGHLS